MGNLGLCNQAPRRLVRTYEFEKHGVIRVEREEVFSFFDTGSMGKQGKVTICKTIQATMVGNTHPFMQSR